MRTAVSSIGIDQHPTAATSLTVTVQDREQQTQFSLDLFGMYHVREVHAYVP